MLLRVRRARALSLWNRPTRSNIVAHEHPKNLESNRTRYRPVRCLCRRQHVQSTRVRLNLSVPDSRPNTRDDDVSEAFLGILNTSQKAGR